MNATIPTVTSSEDTHEVLDELLKNEDGELYGVGFDQVQSLPVFDPYLHLIRDKHYADLGKSFVLAQKEILRQSEHMVAHGTLTPTKFTTLCGHARIGKDYDRGIGAYPMPKPFIPGHTQSLNPFTQFVKYLRHSK